MPYIVVENTPGYLPETMPIEFTELDDAVMYAEGVAKAFATLFGDPNASPIITRETPMRWRVSTDYPNALDHVIEVVDSDDQ